MIPPLEELDPPERREVERRLAEHLRKTRLLSLALMAGLALVGGGAAWAAASGFLAEPLAALPEAITWAVGLYVVVSVVGARFVSRTVLARVSEGAGAEAALERHFAAVVVGMGLREGAGIFGAVWGALIGSLLWVVVLAVPPLLTMIVAWPRRRDLLELLRRHVGRGGPASGE